MAVLLLVILHFVGVFGLSVPELKAYLLPFSPFNLLTSLVLICLAQKEKNMPFAILCLTVFLFGITAEVLGVQTGLVFGDYHYGETLGFKLLGVPPIIGVNWLLCILSVGSVLTYLTISNWMKVMLGASILVVLDVLIEPVAVALDFWTWENGIIPIQNYAAWWVISMLMFCIYYALSFEKRNPVAATQLLLFFLFFGILNLMVT